MSSSVASGRMSIGQRLLLGSGGWQHPAVGTAVQRGWTGFPHGDTGAGRRREIAEGRRPTTVRSHRVVAVIEIEDVAGPGRPGRHRGVRGLERRRRRRLVGRRPPDAGSGAPGSSAPSTPRSSTTSRSTGRWSAPTSAATGRSPGPAPRSRSPARPTCDRDVILIRGIEPNMRWRQFCAELLAACRRPRRPDRGHPRAPCSPTPRTPARSR